MDKTHQVEEKLLLNMCMYEWLTTITVGISIVAFMIVGWYAMDAKVENAKNGEEFSRLGVAEKTVVEK